MHIAGSTASLTPQQRELIELAATLGRDKLAPRAARYDRDATFPFENYEDMHQAGLLSCTACEALFATGAANEPTSDRSCWSCRWRTRWAAQWSAPTPAMMRSSSAE